jgi:hypothetical protein
MVIISTVFPNVFTSRARLPGFIVIKYITMYITYIIIGRVRCPCSSFCTIRNNSVRKNFPQISKSANQQIRKSANPQISKSANPQIRKWTRSRTWLLGKKLTPWGECSLPGGEHTYLERMGEQRIFTPRGKLLT